jgi:hypothetical protein
MRYVVAIIGGIFIFGSVLILSALLTPVLPLSMRQTFQFGPLYTNNIVGVCFAITCAAAAIRDSLLHAEKRRKAKQIKQLVS